MKLFSPGLGTNRWRGMAVQRALPNPQPSGHFGPIKSPKLEKKTLQARKKIGWTDRFRAKTGRDEVPVVNCLNNKTSGSLCLFLADKDLEPWASGLEEFG